MRSHISNILHLTFATLALATVTTACTESFADRCRREAREYTERECPRMEHQFVIMDSMTYADEPQGFTYHYRLTGDFDNPELLTQEVLDEFTAQMRQSLRENLSLRAYKERDFTFTYRYLSERTDSLVLEASFGPEDYK